MVAKTAVSLGVVVLAGSLVGFGDASRVDGGARSHPNAARVAAPPASRPTEAMETLEPYGLECQADVVAYARMGRRFERDGRALVRVHLHRVLKGQVDSAFVDAPDTMPFLGCIHPPRLPKPSEVHPPRTSVVAYLISNQGGWSILALSPHSAGSDRPRLERFIAVAAAGEHEDPVRRYRELLAPEAGGIDEPAIYALRYYPNAHATAVLLELLEPLVAAIVGVDGSGTTPDESAFLKLTAVLPDSDAIEPLVACLPHLSREFRFRVFDRLGTMGALMSPELRADVRARLISELADPGLARDEYSSQRVVRALGRLADLEAVRVLITELRRQKSDPAVQVIKALGAAGRHVGPEAQVMTREAFLRILSEVAPATKPEAGEITVIRSILGELTRHGLDPATEWRLRVVRSRYAGGWLHDEMAIWLGE